MGGPACVGPSQGDREEAAVTEHKITFTEYPSGKIRSIIADGTHWVTVAEANSRAQTASREVHRLTSERDELLEKVRSLPFYHSPGGMQLLERAEVLALFDKTGGTK